MAETVTCPGCKKKYALKPELAGKRAKCKCGEKIQFPAAGKAAPPEAQAEIPLEARDDKPQKGKSAIFEPLDVSGAYDLAGDSRPAPTPIPTPARNVCTHCKKPLAPSAVICMACGFNQKTGSAVRTQVLAVPQAASTSSPASSAGSGSGVKNLLIGGIVCALGTVVTVIGFMHPDSDGKFRIMIGAIIFGGIQALRGLMQIISGS